ncbi:monocarboxylate transporter 8 isoform X3 [Salmo trutta]|uniref:monocarboxylate transporter 8 isoform X3 n=1 Tax=Salmo trutta TaxID=8032 RepID=UPI00113119E1|nr:monocarboxylate transporter 8-like isoform X3 [Salmo trutta]
MESQKTQSEIPDPGLAQSLGTYLSYYEHEEMKRDGSRPDCETEENKDPSSQIVSCARADSAPDLECFPEGRFVWLVVLAATWCNGSIFGIQKSFGIIHMMLVKAHKDSNNDVSQFAIAWVGALAMGMVFLCSPLVSIVTDHLGCRVTAICGALVAFLGLLTSSFTVSLGLWYFTYGVLFGCGSSFVFLPSLVTLGHYFPQRLGLVNGVVMAGSSVFSISLPALLEEVGTPLGLSTTFQILSALMLIQAAMAFSFRSRLYHRDLSTNTAQDSSANLSSGWQQGLAQTRRYCNLGVFHLPSYRVWAFGVATAMLGNFVPYIYLMSFVEEQFVETPVKEWVLLVCIGVTSCVGRLLFGRVGDLLHGARKIYLQGYSMTTLEITTWPSTWLGFLPWSEVSCSSLSRMFINAYWRVSKKPSQDPALTSSYPLLALTTSPLPPLVTGSPQPALTTSPLPSLVTSCPQPALTSSYPLLALTTSPLPSLVTSCPQPALTSSYPLLALTTSPLPSLVTSSPQPALTTSPLPSLVTSSPQPALTNSPLPSLVITIAATTQECCQQ